MESAPQPHEVHQQPYQMSRRQMIAGALATGALIFGGTVLEATRPDIRPHGPARPKTTPLPDGFYEINQAEQEPVPYDVIHTKQTHSELEAASQQAMDNQELEELGANMLGDYSGGFTIGRTDFLEDWLAYAGEVAARKYRREIPVDLLSVDFSQPTLEYAREALLQISSRFGAIPVALLSKTGVGEQAIVDTLTVRGGIPHIAERTITMNGASDLKRFNLVETTNNRHSGNLRQVGNGLLGRVATLIDRHNVGTEDTFNDLAYYQLLYPDVPEDQLQANLDDESRYEKNIRLVATSKQTRIIELLQGQLILPSDAEYDGLRQKQQAMLLERLQASYPEIDLHFYRQLRDARDRLGHAPRFQEELFEA